MSVAARVRFEADSLMAAAEDQIVRTEYARSLREPPWDGKLVMLSMP